MKLTNITEICDIQIGRTPKRSEDKYWGEGHNWLSIADMDSKYVFDSKEQVTDLAVDECRMKIVPKNTVVMSFKLTIGRLGITDKELYTNEAIAAFLIKDKNLILPEYLYYSLKGYNFDHLIDRAAKGKTLNKRKLSEIYIPLLSIDKQKRIIDILNKAENLLRKRQQQIEALSALKQSIFLNMFGHPKLNPNNYPITKLESLVEQITDGTHHSPPLVDNGVPYITARHLRTGELDFYSTPTYVSEESHKDIFQRCAPSKGDVLYIKDGATTGIAAINKYEFEFSLLSSVALIKNNKDVLNNRYLIHFLNNETVKNDILRQMSGGAIRRLTLKKIKEIEITLPPIDRQLDFALKIKKIEDSESEFKKSFEQILNLYNSLLHKAFNGELFKEKIKA